MANEVQLDALPYVDQGYDEPGVRDEVSCYNSKFQPCVCVCVCV